MKGTRFALMLSAASLVAGCSPGADDPAAGGVSTREAEALNDAAEMLDDNRGDPALVTNADDGPDGGAGNAE